VDLRYIGTLTRHNFSSKNINVPNFLTNGLLEAFDAARAGQDPVLLDQLLNGLRIPGTGNCTVDGITCKGGAALRAANSYSFNLRTGTGAFTNLNQMLALGNYQGLANQINSFSGTGTGYTSPGQFLETNGFPINFIKASPQFANATLYENQGYANYHSFQAQVTLRPTHGVYFQSTYTWSKNLGNSGGISPDPRNLRTGYVLQASDRPHNWVTYGTYDLPFGPGGLVGTSLHGAWAKAAGGWQIGWISTVQSGAPLAISANCGLYGNCTPDEVNGGIDPNSTSVDWPHGNANGSLFPFIKSGSQYTNRYSFTKDPQCLSIAAGLQSLCTSQAVVDNTNGNIVLQNPWPGKMGTMGFNKFRNLVRWNVDASISKSVAVDESKSFRFRVDITNIFNHPFASGAGATGTGGYSGVRLVFPVAPSMNINGTSPLGFYAVKVGGRTVQAMARFDF
jgi:hypothetical protein